MAAIQAPHKKAILLIEDEEDVRELIALHLGREGYVVEAFPDAETGLGRLESGKIDLCVVDWMLPGMSGVDLARTIRGELKSAVPVLMVTARAEAADIVLGLESGADDYITKPFEVPVLLARVRALLRRSIGAGLKAQQAQERLRAGEIEVDIAAHEARCRGDLLALTPSEFNILRVLLQNQGRVMTRDQLIDLIRGEDVSIVARAIDTHVFGLRKKLGDCNELIETIRGVGYRIKA